MGVYRSPTAPRNCESSALKIPHASTALPRESNKTCFVTGQDRSASFITSCQVTAFGVRCPSLCHAASRSPVQNIAVLPLRVIKLCAIELSFVSYWNRTELFLFLEVDRFHGTANQLG